MVKSINRIRSLTQTRIAECYRRFFNPSKYKSLKFLLDYLGGDIKINDEAKSVLNTTISHICTLDSWYFPRNCACLVYRNPVYNDNDYHADYADKAISRGATIILTNKSIDGIPCVISENPVAVYAKLCRYYRDLSSGLSVIAISGSIGKTTTKNMIAEVLKMKYKTSYTSSNLNARGPVGFAAQHIPKGTDYLIQEIHEGEPGETQYLSEIIHPNLFVITSIDLSHLAMFESVEDIKEEICSISKNMAEDGSVIVNVDEFDRFDLLNGRRIITVSAHDMNADFYADSPIVDQYGISFNIIRKSNGQKSNVRLNNIFAFHNVVSALYAYAIGALANVPSDDMVLGLSHFQSHDFRQNVIRINGIVIYADCYNAVDKSMRSAIETVDTFSTGGKRIAVLGDVEEAGQMTESTHINIVNYVNSSRFDILFVIGEKIKAGLSSVKLRDSLIVQSFDTIESLTSAIKRVILPGDVILFKASHASHLEKCIIKIWPSLKNELSYSTKMAERWKQKSLFY